MLSRVGVNLARMLTAITCIWPMLVDVSLSIKYSDITMAIAVIHILRVWPEWIVLF